jgi:tetratricopeptide (TPR) repeat protein
MSRSAIIGCLAVVAASSVLSAVSGAATNPVETPAWRFYQHDDNAAVLKRPAGTLLLNMLIKNEEAHLARTLPKWAKLPIDAWIIGVDDNNTDSSVEVIRRELGHIPGRIVTVHFDGMGPTWTKLVEAGWQYYPNITHGILADADFAPTDETLRAGGFDKRELDVRCSKHIYTIVSADRSRTNSRKLDWIYRNMPGVTVKRRTHQSLHAPSMPGHANGKGHPEVISVSSLDILDVDEISDDNEVVQSSLGPDSDMYITEVPSLLIDEAPGGWQDRAGGALAKAKRYIEFLEGDLREFGPDDSRSLYYLGIGHFDAFGAAIREVNNDWSRLTKEDWDMLARGENYMKRRIALPPSDDVGKKEERWFALLKLGEVRERFHGDYDTSLSQYMEAARSDPDRADAWFYAGQNLRLRQQRGQNEETFSALTESLAFLFHGSHLPMPDRALFQWKLMYSCLPSLEMARTMDAYLQLHEQAGKPVVFVTDGVEDKGASSIKESAKYRSEFRKIGDEIKAALSGMKPRHNGDLEGAAEKIATTRRRLASLPLYLQFLDVARSRARHAGSDCAAEGEGAMAQEARQLSERLDEAFEKAVRNKGGDGLISVSEWKRRKNGGEPASASPAHKEQAQPVTTSSSDEQKKASSSSTDKKDKKKAVKFPELDPLELVYLPGFSLFEPTKATFWPEAQPNEEVYRLACEYQAEFDGDDARKRKCRKRFGSSKKKAATAAAKSS